MKKHHEFASLPAHNARHTQKILDVPVDVISFGEAKNRILEWGHAHLSRYVVFANVHVVVTATEDVEFGTTITNADMVTPDGAPLAWMLRKLGAPLQRRVSGPDITWALLGRCERESVSVYFFGSSQKTLSLLQAHIATAFPLLTVAGFESPPFRPMTEQEDRDSVQRINDSGAGIVFVGLGCPKQEQWMHSHRGRINAVMLGVGAAFDFHAGTVTRAPVWMRRSGLEWLHRLYSEPGRLWKRYLVTNTIFIFRAIAELLKKWSHE